MTSIYKPTARRQTRVVCPHAAVTPSGHDIALTKTRDSIVACRLLKARLAEGTDPIVLIYAARWYAPGRFENWREMPYLKQTEALFEWSDKMVRCATDSNRLNDVLRIEVVACARDGPLHQMAISNSRMVQQRMVGFADEAQCARNLCAMGGGKEESAAAPPP